MGAGCLTFRSLTASSSWPTGSTAGLAVLAAMARPLLSPVPQHSRFIGVIGMNERGDGTVEISYGIAPRWRRRGLATHAARLSSQWIASQPGVHRVEARIGQGDRAGERVAVKAGFELATAVRPIPGTGQVPDDLLYVLGQGGLS